MFLNKNKKKLAFIKSFIYNNHCVRERNGSAEIVVNAKEGQSLFTSIPYCDGWTVKVNGQKVQPDKVVDSLYSISLVEGENVVEMKFHVKYAGAGIACSIIGIAMLVFAEFYRKRRK